MFQKLEGEPPFCAVHRAVCMCLDYEVPTIPETVTESVQLGPMIALTQAPRTTPRSQTPPPHSPRADTGTPTREMRSRS